MRITNRKSSDYAARREPFKTSNGTIYGRKCGKQGYAVFSYGEHWPLHVWDGAQWSHNADKYSVTTSKHYGQSNPDYTGSQLDCRAMRDLVDRLDRERTEYQPKTGQPCHCRPGVWRDNCPNCEGTGLVIDFGAIRKG